MSSWELGHPYRLLDARIACEMQFVFEDESSAFALLSALPEFRHAVDALNAQAEVDIEDYSFELAAVSVREKGRTCLRSALIMRVCAAEDCDVESLSKGAYKLREAVAAWLKKNALIFTETDDDRSVLVHYPVWLPKSENPLCVGVAQKKAELIRVDGRSTLWSHDIGPEARLDLKALCRMLKAHPKCGMSLEIHSLPASFQEAISAMPSDHEGFCAWQSAVSAGDAMLARLAVWGDRGFVDGASGAVKTQLDVEMVSPAFDIALSNYMVYDPWAFMTRVVDNALRLGPAQYTLCRSEAAALTSSLLPSGKDAIPVQSPSDVEVLMPIMHPIGGGNGLSDVLPALHDVVQSVMEQTVMPGLRGVQQSVDQVYETTQRIDSRLAEWLNGTQKYFGDNREELSRLSQKMDDIAAFAERYDKIAQGGLIVAFTPNELKCLGVDSEEQLASELHLDEVTIRLMRTAFSFARAGVLVGDSDAAIMPFFFPLTALYEHLMRSWFQPALFDHSPHRQELNARPNSDKSSIDLREFDRIDDNQINAYANSAVIQGKRFERTDWIIWLNIFRCIRAIRNKAHTERGQGTLKELNLLYPLMLCSGEDPKKAVLSHFCNMNNADSVLFFLGIHFQAIDRRMDNDNWQHAPSVISFLLLCRDAQWKD